MSAYGYIPDLPDNRDSIFNLEKKVLRVDQAPLGPLNRVLPNEALNQLTIGSCTAHGIDGALLYEEHLQGQPPTARSRLFIYYQERLREGTVYSDSGAQIRTGIKVVASDGAPPESDWPYHVSKFAIRPPDAAYTAAKSHRALTYHRVLLDGIGAALRTALVQRPVVMGFAVPEYFESLSWDPANQPLPLPVGERFIGGHCTLAYDFDWTCTRFPFPVVKIRNSWGRKWGNNGDFWMDARWFAAGANLVSDLWIISKTS